ncbi:hypothetical protein [Saccharothrix sp. HUAS TT1]|uniref:hypothetical protein n=1 Tax=unclassified Saccharothrix TaxID=2593673 RepID=UPI00345C0BDE
MGVAVAEDVRRARDQVDRVVEKRPEAAPDGQGLPPRLLRRDLGLTVAAGVLDLSAAAAAVALGPDSGLTTMTGVGVGMVGANAVIERFQEVRRRNAGAARLREHGADAADTLAALRHDAPTPRWALVLWAAIQLALVALLAVVVFQAWSTGPLAQVVAVVAVAFRLAAGALSYRYYARRNRWLPDFAREEGIALPPLPEQWQVLVHRR